METAEHELEERRERMASLEKALDDTRVAHEQRERELGVQVKDYRYSEVLWADLSIVLVFLYLRICMCTVYACLFSLQQL